MDMQEVPHYLGKRNDLNEISSRSKIQYDHQVIWNVNQEDPNA